MNEDFGLKLKHQNRSFIEQILPIFPRLQRLLTTAMQN